MRKNPKLKKINPLAKCAVRCREVLAHQHAQGQPPGSILADLKVMLEAIGASGVTTKGRQGNLPLDLLPVLNTRLSQPIEIVMRRALLRDYPNVGGLYILLRVLGLARVDRSRIRIDEGSLEKWQALNPFEQYFSLLETWLVKASGQVMGKGYWEEQEQFPANLDFLGNLPTDQWESFDESVHIQRFGISPWNAQLQARFGLTEIAALPMAARQMPIHTWMLGAARRTAWGEAVVWAILDMVGCPRGDYWHLRPPNGAAVGCLQPAFRPFFPQWERTFSLAELAARPGMYIFKVSLDPRRYGGSVWRRLAVPDVTSLASLADAVLRAFNFYDDDHLYAFTYRDQLGRTREYHPSGMEDGLSSHEVTVEECGLPEKAMMLFRFDFGDDWRFWLRLEEIRSDGPRSSQPAVIATEGQPPPQYPNRE